MLVITMGYVLAFRVLQYVLLAWQTGTLPACIQGLSTETETDAGKTKQYKAVPTTGSGADQAGAVNAEVEMTSAAGKE